MMSEKIKILLLKEGWSVVDVAKGLGTSPQNMYNKLKRDNFSEEDLREIAQLLGCEVEIKFKTTKGEYI